MSKGFKQVLYFLGVFAILVAFLPPVAQADGTVILISSPASGQHFKDGDTMLVKVLPALAGGSVEFKFEYWRPAYSGPAGPQTSGGWESGHFLLPPDNASGPSASAGLMLPMNKSIFELFGRWRISARYYDGTSNPWSPWVEFNYDSVTWSKTPPVITKPTSYEHFLGMVYFAVKDPPDLPANAVTVLDFQYQNNSPVYNYSPITAIPIFGGEHVGKHNFYPGEWKVHAAYKTNGNEMTQWSAWVPFTIDGNTWISFDSPKAGATSLNGVTVKTLNNYPYVNVPVQIQVAQNVNGAWVNAHQFQSTNQELILGLLLPLKTYFDDSPGKWRLRARYLFYQDANGPWSDWLEFNMTKAVRMQQLP